MDKLIITAACDSRTSYPHNPLCPPQEDVAGVTNRFMCREVGARRAAPPPVARGGA